MQVWRPFKYIKECWNKLFLLRNPSLCEVITFCHDSASRWAILPPSDFLNSIDFFFWRSQITSGGINWKLIYISENEKSMMFNKNFLLYIEVFYKEQLIATYFGIFEESLDCRISDLSSHAIEYADIGTTRVMICKFLTLCNEIVNKNCLI